MFTKKQKKTEKLAKSVEFVCGKLKLSSIHEVQQIRQQNRKVEKRKRKQFSKD